MPQIFDNIDNPFLPALQDDQDPNDQYARLYSQEVVEVIHDLTLPRYGRGNYITPHPENPPTPNEQRQIQDLSRAGKRLMGFCRTNLFKRLESSGMTFLQSVERHILRNYVFLQAIEEGLPLPIGTQDAALLDPGFSDEDKDTAQTELFGDGGDENGNKSEGAQKSFSLRSEKDFRRRAEEIYRPLSGRSIENPGYPKNSRGLGRYRQS